jgi:hypothetical protein
MKHIIVSVYQNDLPESISRYQKKVFDYFNIPLEQIVFENKSEMHSFTMDSLLKSRENQNWDYFTFFDVDCIPIKSDVIEKSLEKISDGKTLYGNAQSSNTYSSNPVKTPPFIAPSFLNISRRLWENYKENYPNYLDRDIFKFCQQCKNPEGEISESDVAEEFTKENKSIGHNISYSYPIKTYSNPEWEFLGGWGHKPFKFGNYTEFESGTFHNFQIRYPQHQDFFINYCKKIINEN